MALGSAGLFNASGAALLAFGVTCATCPVVKWRSRPKPRQTILDALEAGVAERAVPWVPASLK